MFTMDGRIRFSEVGPDGRLSMHQLLNYFQDTSTFHLADHKIGLPGTGMPREGLAFFMVSWQIHILRLPSLGEEIRTSTLMYEGKGAFGHRNYTMYDKAGQCLAYANMNGCFIDTNTLMPVKLTPAEREIYHLEDRIDMEYLPRRIAHPPLLKLWDGVEVMTRHLDENNHVNNAEYLAMALSYLPEGLNPQLIRAEYKAAAKLGDCLIPKSAVDEAGTFYLGFFSKEGAPFANFSFS